MALTYVGGVTGVGASADYSVSINGTLTGGLASSPSTGDIVIVGTGNARGLDFNVTLTTLGYAELCDLTSSDTNWANFGAFWKIMGVTPDTSVGVKGTSNAAVGSSIVVHVWRGVDQATPIDVTTTTNVGANGNGVDSPAITPVTSGAVVLTIGGCATAAAKTVSTVPAGYSNNLIASTDPGTAFSSVVASKSWTTGEENPAAWVFNSTSTQDSWCAATIALRPAAASGPTNLKTYNTNLKANIKSINTNLLSNIKSLNTNI